MYELIYCLRSMFIRIITSKQTKEIRAFRVSCSFSAAVLFEIALINIVMSTMDLVVTYVKVLALTDERREVWLNSAGPLRSGEQFITFSSLCWFPDSIFTVSVHSHHSYKDIHGQIRHNGFVFVYFCIRKSLIHLFITSLEGHIFCI